MAGEKIEVLPPRSEVARRDSTGGVAVTATGAETRSARLKGFTLGELVKMGEIAASAGMFGGRRPEDQVTPAQATMKILAGLEIDVPMTQALAMIDIIDGNPAYRANLLAAVIKRSRKYAYRVVDWTDDRCEISWRERDEDSGEWGEWDDPGPPTKFDLEDARRANLLGKGSRAYERYPRSMYFARALSAGARAYCGDVIAAGYTSEELYEEPRQPETYDEYAEKVNAPRGDAPIEADAVEVPNEDSDPSPTPTPAEPPNSTAASASPTAPPPEPAASHPPAAAPAEEPTPEPEPSPEPTEVMQSLLEVVGATPLEQLARVKPVTVKQIAHLRKIAKPLDDDGLSRVLAWATRNDGEYATRIVSNLPDVRYAELAHVFENAPKGHPDRAALVEAVVYWEKRIEVAQSVGDGQGKLV